MVTANASRNRIFLALAIIYFVWGTSFIATKVMVTDEPPLFAAGLRFTLAGILLTAFSCFRYGRPNLARRELRHILVMAGLAVLFSNACHVIAMQYVQSNTAAFLNATPALWIAWLGTFDIDGPGKRVNSIHIDAVEGFGVGSLLNLPAGGLVGEGLDDARRWHPDGGFDQAAELVMRLVRVQHEIRLGGRYSGGLPGGFCAAAGREDHEASRQECDAARSISG